MILKTIILFTIAFTNTLATHKNCRYSKFTRFHSYCKSRNPQCNIFDAGLTDEEKDIIIKAHNEYRSKVALGKERLGGILPQAADMLEMEWDDELASIAQKYAEQCKFAHDCLKCREVDRFKVGQNIFESYSINRRPKAASLKAGVKKWYDEVNVFSKDIVSKYRHRGSTPIGHFTQVIWSKSWKVGCGAVQYKKEPNLKFLFLVCNYGPAGNSVNKPVYHVGEPCSACPRNSCCGNFCDKQASFPGLCKMNDGTNL